MIKKRPSEENQPEYFPIPRLAAHAKDQCGNEKNSKDPVIGQHVEEKVVRFLRIARVFVGAEAMAEKRSRLELFEHFAPQRKPLLSTGIVSPEAQPLEVRRTPAFGSPERVAELHREKERAYHSTAY